jgi:hypothetical protein
MNNNAKDKKSKKKVPKRKRSEEDIQMEAHFSETQVEVIVPMAVEQDILEAEYMTCLDVFRNNNINLKGKKGHSSHYSKQTIETGTFYFEVTVLSLDYNFAEYVNPRRIDEFSKKYYEPILQNIKGYSPNIRVGFISAHEELDLPLGADEKSYGYRCSDGSLINDGDYLEGNSNYSQGDVIGALIHLKPPMPEFLRSNLSQVNECYIKFFKNGIEQPKGFYGIIEGSYHAAVTLYNFSQANINFGPKFKFPISEENKNVKSFNDL